MAKKLLSEAQVRKFMGLANMDVNLSSNFLTEMYGQEEEMKEEEMDAEMADMDMADAAPEGGEDLGDADGAEDDKQALTTKLMQAVADIMGVEVDIDSEPAGEMDAPEEPPMDDMDDMDADEEPEEPDMMSEVELELSEDEIVQEVAKRVAKRINEAARAQKKADRLLGRKK